MNRIRVDAQNCSGCRFCEMVCSFHHEGIFSPSLSRVTVVKEDKYGLDYPVLCHQCDPCPSLEACPTGALTRIEVGVINVDKEICTGCKACVDACTFNAIKLDGSSTPVICDLCGGKPQCVERCPTKALSFMESEKDFELLEAAFKNLLRRWNING